jgi:hypothetical protein
MSLIKIADGLLEYDNFLLTSQIEDFLGNGKYSKTLNKFVLKTGEVKRPFLNNDFVLEITKDPIELLKEDRFLFFIETENEKIGMEEVQGKDQIKHWKIILSNGFIQTYTSMNGIEWINIGGIPLEKSEIVKYQGFLQEGKTHLVIRDYQVYKNPYVTIQNFPPGTKVKVLDNKDTLIKERLFDENMEAKIFLDYCLLGRLAFYDLEDKLILKSSLLNLKYGDIYAYAPKRLQLIHEGKILFYETENLKSCEEKLILKNPNQVVFENVNLKVIKNNSDIIELSSDGENYTNHLMLNKINPSEEIEIKLRIIGNKSKPVFTTSEFSIDIF